MLDLGHLLVATILGDDTGTAEDVKLNPELPSNAKQHYYDAFNICITDIHAIIKKARDFNLQAKELVRNFFFRTSKDLGIAEGIWRSIGRQNRNWWNHFTLELILRQCKLNIDSLSQIYVRQVASGKFFFLSKLTHFEGSRVTCLPWNSTVLRWSFSPSSRLYDW